MREAGVWHRWVGWSQSSSSKHSEEEGRSHRVRLQAWCQSGMEGARSGVGVTHRGSQSPRGVKYPCVWMAQNGMASQGEEGILTGPLKKSRSPKTT